METNDSDDKEAGYRAFEAEDYEKAFLLLLPYAEQGDARAQRNIASMYHLGAGAIADGRKAVEWYLKAAQQEIQEERSMSALVYHNLGAIYVEGAPGVEPDRELAKQCWRKSLALGSNLVPPEWAK